MNWDEIDWKTLERLRGVFLEGRPGSADYWQSESDLAHYDATFAQRIGWKWDFVFAELSRRGWSPPKGDLLDWGCGSGIASRAFLDHFGRETTTKLFYWDRSALAMRYAANRAREKNPGLEVIAGQTAQPAVALISHVLTELEPPSVEALVDRLAKQATAILWVEPGTFEASLALIAIRERLRGQIQVVAPCTHQGQCGILAPGNEAHWCHQFAEPPAAVFTDPFWGKFAHLMGVDLRSLPLSFLALDKRPAPPLPAGATWRIGHPRIYKGYALLLASGADGVQERRLSQRQLPEAFRQARKGTLDPLMVLKSEGREIISTQPVAPKDPKSPPES